MSMFHVLTSFLCAFDVCLCILSPAAAAAGAWRGSEAHHSERHESSHVLSSARVECGEIYGSVSPYKISTGMRIVCPSLVTRKQARKQREFE